MTQIERRPSYFRDDAVIILAGRRLSSGIDVKIIEARFLCRTSFLGVQLVANRIVNVAFVNLPHPCGELGRVGALKLRDLTKDRQAGLLHDIRGVYPGLKTGRKRLVGNLSQMIPIGLQKQPDGCFITRLRLSYELGIIHDVPCQPNKPEAVEFAGENRSDFRRIGRERSLRVTGPMQKANDSNDFD